MSKVNKILLEGVHLTPVLECRIGHTYPWVGTFRYDSNAISTRQGFYVGHRKPKEDGWVI